MAFRYASSVSLLPVSTSLTSCSNTSRATFRTSSRFISTTSHRILILSPKVSYDITLDMVASAAQPADQFAFEFAFAAQSTSSHLLHLRIASFLGNLGLGFGLGLPDGVTQGLDTGRSLRPRMNIPFICNQGEKRMKTVIQLPFGRFQVVCDDPYGDTRTTESQLSRLIMVSLARPALRA
jgi:hypothetical protein